MFSKFMKFFEVKEDETLDYMDPDKLKKSKKVVQNTPLSQEDEDDFFRQLEEEDLRIEEKPRFEHVKPQQKVSEPPRESVLEKMRQCMHERDWNLAHHPKVLIGGACMLVGGILLAFILRETPNPLLGKWQPQKKSNIFVPTGDIEFKKDQLLANGVTTPIKYNIEKQYVEVIDLNSKMHIPFYVTSDKTIELNLLGVKTTYKKLDK